ncbi:MAG: hypothetical protein ABFD92_07940 [Planctomycetaceae bacterium]|nr:hypothetical protein [Planctomycetaceae bacterium]
MIKPEDLAAFLTVRFGLPVIADSRRLPEGQQLTVRPADVPRTIGFSVSFVVGWRAIEAHFMPASYAVELVQAMQAATVDQKAAFRIFAASAVQKGAPIKMTIGGIPADPAAPDTWPSAWRSVEFSMRKGALVITPEDPLRETQTVFPWAATFFGITLALLPLEPAESAVPVGEAEGAVTLAKVRRYERSRINRAACIEINGVRCCVCGFHFGEQYGRVGDGFIHVHHLEPLSMMQESYVIDPAIHLVPICPNCHSMAHRKTPPYTPAELKEMRSLGIQSGLHN